MTHAIDLGVDHTNGPAVSHSPPAVSLSGLTKRYGDRVAVDRLTIEVPAGVVAGFVGPNGAGKTTTMRIVLGVLEPDAGELRCCGSRSGYALYASLFASAGALVSRQEDLQSSTTPLTLLVIASYLLSFVALQDPGGSLARIASLVPVSSPLVMPARLALGEASAGEAALAGAIIALTTLAVMRFGARVYEGAVLRTGKPVGLREALRSPAR